MTYARNDGKTSEKDSARTPMPIFIPLDAEFHFDLDAAADPHNTLCPGYYTKEDDALNLPWYEDLGEDGVVKSIWCNPPYSAGQIIKWVHKAWLESGNGATVVMLIPADASTEYFDFCFHNVAEIRFMQPRVKFNRPDGTPFDSSPQMGSMIVVFRPGEDGPAKCKVWKWKNE